MERTIVADEGVFFEGGKEIDDLMEGGQKTEASRDPAEIGSYQD
jgi:hypothetical protein